MAYPKPKNDIFKDLLQITYERFKKAQDIAELNIRRKTEYVEFFREESDTTDGQLYKDCFPDPDGSYTGCAFQLSSMGYLIPVVVARYGVSNFAFKISKPGVELFENKDKLEQYFPSAEGNYVFVIMSFSENNILNDAYKLAIKPVTEKLGYICIRVDEIEHNRRITDKVIECIRNSRFIIADLTEQRPNCYYELGFAHGLNKEVIHIVYEGEPIHFDIKDYNFIIYPNVSELKERLNERIIKTIEPLAKVSSGLSF